VEVSHNLAPFNVFRWGNHNNNVANVLIPNNNNNNVMHMANINNNHEHDVDNSVLTGWADQIGDMFPQVSYY
jgi:hypothetical protein